MTVAMDKTVVVYFIPNPGSVFVTGYIFQCPADSQRSGNTKSQQTKCHGIPSFMVGYGLYTYSDLYVLPQNRNKVGITYPVPFAFWLKVELEFYY